MDRSFHIPADQEAFIDEAVRSGRFETADEVVRESLRLLQEREEQVARFKAEIQKGIDAADRGELIDADEAFDRLDAMIEDIAAAKRA